MKVPKWNLPLTSNNIFVHLEFSPFPNLGEGVHFLWDPTGHHRSAVWRGWEAEGPPKDFVVGWRARSVPLMWAPMPGFICPGKPVESLLPCFIWPGREDFGSWKNDSGNFLWRKGICPPSSEFGLAAYWKSASSSFPLFSLTCTTCVPFRSCMSCDILTIQKYNTRSNERSEEFLAAHRSYHKRKLWRNLELPLNFQRMEDTITSWTKNLAKPHHNKHTKICIAQDKIALQIHE